MTMFPVVGVSMATPVAAPAPTQMSGILIMWTLTRAVKESGSYVGCSPHSGFLCQIF